MLLADEPVNNKTIAECINIKQKTNVNIIIIAFGHQQTYATIESYPVTNLTSAVKAVMNYYK